MAAKKALQFLAGYVVEVSLSVDNLFVILLVFGYSQVPVPYRHRVLFWGIFGALIMRACFIAAGSTLVARLDWVIYGFGALLLASGIKNAAEDWIDSSRKKPDTATVPVLYSSDP
jgi:tellurite resistance protein TerC